MKYCLFIIMALAAASCAYNLMVEQALLENSKETSLLGNSFGISNLDFNIIGPKLTTHFYYFYINRAAASQFSLSYSKDWFASALSKDMINYKIYRITGLEYLNISETETFTECEEKSENESVCQAKTIKKEIPYVNISYLEIANDFSAGTTKNYYLISFDTPNWKKGSFNISFNSPAGLTELDPDISACGDITSPGIYNVSNFSTNLNGNCILINSSNVTIDCGGNTITGNISAGTSQDLIAIASSDFTNITIQNCVFTNAGRAGVSIEQTTNNVVLSNLTFNNCASYGIYAASIRTYNIDKITTTGNITYPISLYDTYDGIISNFNDTCTLSSIHFGVNAPSGSNHRNISIYNVSIIAPPAGSNGYMHIQYADNGFLLDNITTQTTSLAASPRGVYIRYCNNVTLQNSNSTMRGAALFIDDNTNISILNNYFQTTTATSVVDIDDTSYLEFHNNYIYPVNFRVTYWRDGSFGNWTNNTIVRGFLYMDNAYFYNNTFTGGTSSYPALSIQSEANNNTFWGNRFINESLDYISNSGTNNSFNLSVSGTMIGNWYGDINSWNITDTDDDNFGDSGSDYPYNSSQTLWEGSGNDWSPCMFEDCKPPAIIVTLHEPTNNYYTQENHSLLNYSVHIGTSDSNCTLYGSEDSFPTDVLQTNDSLDIGDYNETFNWTDLNETTYYWRVYCTDGVNTFNTSTRHFTTDYTNPIINITAPPDNSLFNISSSTTSYIINTSYTEANVNECWFTNTSDGNVTYTCSDDYFTFVELNGTDLTTNISAYISDLSGREANDIITNITFNFADGTIENISTSSGPFQRAMIYSIFANATCEGDWCENVSYTFFDCNGSANFIVSTNESGVIGNVNESGLLFQTAEAYWALDGNYYLGINFTLANGTNYTECTSLYVITGGGSDPEMVSCINTGYYLNGTLCPIGGIISSLADIGTGTQSKGNSLLFYLLFLFICLLIVYFLFGGDQHAKV